MLRSLLPELRPRCAQELRRAPEPGSGEDRRPGRLSRRATAALAAVGLVAAGASWAAPTAHGTAGPGTYSGPQGQTVTVTQSTDLDPAGTEVTVSGTGFDEAVGIYVAVCVDRGADARPTPCLGGVDTTGGSGASGWISSNPPTYGKGLAVPFGDGGSFELTTTVVAQDALTDCLDAAKAPDGCVIATFADHTRIDERSADVRIPLTFSEGGVADPSVSATQDAEPAPTPSAAPAPATSTDGAPGDAASPPPASDASASAAAASGSASPGLSPLTWGALAAVVVAGTGATLLARRRGPRAERSTGERSAEHDD